MVRKLPRQDWRYIRPTVHAATTTGCIAAIKGLVINSATQWRLVETPNTGSTSLLLQPVTSSFQGYVVLASAITGSSAYRSPDDNTANGNRLQVGLYAGSASFLGPQRDLPFDGGAQTDRWWGYWHAGVATNVTQSFLVEGSEAIWFGLRGSGSTGGQYGALCGAIGETDELTGEGPGDGQPGALGRRKLGIVTAGTAAITAKFWRLNAFLTHDTTPNLGHAGAWAPTGSSAPGVAFVDTFRHCFSADQSTNDFLTLNAGTGQSLVAFPIHMVTTSSNPCWLRDIWIGPEAPTLTVVSAASTEVGVLVGPNQQTIDHTILFAPASGSPDFQNF